MAKAGQEPSSSSTGACGSPGKDLFGVSSNFFQQFHSPEKAKETTSCTDLVLHEGSKPSYKRSFAKSNLTLDEKNDASRPTLRRQLAKSNFDLDSQDLQTLALALECKSHKATSDVNEPKEMKAPDETQVTPKKKRPAKSKSKKAAKAPAQPAPKCKSKAKAKKKKSSRGSPSGGYKTTFRHRKTSNAYHLAKNMALRAGISPESARIKGKAASAKVVQQIELGTLKEG